MNKMWQLQEAKNRLSEVVEEALQKGPQVITRRGEETAVVLSIKDYQKLVKPKDSLVEFFRKSPLHGVKLDLERNKEPARDVDL